MGFGIPPCNSGPGALRNSDVTMQVNGSISIFDGNGNSSVLFGEQNRPQGSGQLGEWGIQYSGGGLNFWKPSPSSGYGFGNNFLFLSDNGNVGIGATASAAPANALEITSYPASPQPAGLRFTNLTSASTLQPANASASVLSVDANGDVILVPGSSGVGAGYCNALTPLIGNSAGYDLNTFNFYFAGNGSGNTAQNNVVIGNNCTYTTPVAKLDVLQASTFTSGSTGINVLNTDESVNMGATVFGMQCYANPATVNFTDLGNYTAGYFNATGSKINKAVDGLANGLAGNGAANYGGYFVANMGGQNTGVYAKAPVGGGNFAGFFQGDLNVNGTYYQNMSVFTSDRNLKTNIDTISNALGILGQMQPKTFFFDSTAHPQMHFNDRRQYGLIAQDVQPILPELVADATFPAQYDSVGNQTSAAFSYKTLNYNAFIGILIKGMQEQQKQLVSQKSSIDSLRNQLSSCCSQNSRTQNPNSNQNSITNQTNVTLDNSDNIVLNQNVPNPFAEQTTITYHLPDNVQKAQILFYDATGKLIKAVDLTERGDGQLNIFADDLSTGIYSYALVADGNIVDAKKMEKVK